jgi:hypothetical protein
MKNIVKCALVSLFVSSAFLSAETMSVDSLKEIAGKITEKKSSDGVELKDARFVCYKDGKVDSSSDKSLVGKDASDFKDENGKSILDLAKDKLKDSKDPVSFVAMVNGKKRNIIAFMMNDMVCTVAAAAE